MLRKWLPHVAILLSNMYLVFYMIDRVNRAMAFINNDLTKGLLVVLSLVSIFNACLLIHDRRERIRAAQRRAGSARRNPQNAASSQRPATQASEARRSAPQRPASSQRPARRPSPSGSQPSERK